MTAPAARAPQPAVRADRPSHGITVQRKCGCGTSSGGEKMCRNCEKEQQRVQRFATGREHVDGVPSSVTDVLKSPGRSLDPETRAWAESRFRHSFAGVRVHTGPAAAASAREIGAAAYTVGRDVVFADGRYDGSTSEGRRLIAHELTHVIQQRSGTATLPAGVGPADDPHERAADTAADAAVASSGPVTVLAPAPEPAVVRRERDETHDDAPPQQRPRYIVEDDETAAPGQMGRSEFLETLHTAVCATADTEMARLGRSTAGCPALARWRSFADRRTAAQIESGARRYVEEAENVRSARDYIPLITRRVARSIAEWGRSGKMPDVPPELADLGVGGNFSITAGTAIAGAIGGRLGRFLGGIHFKAADGRAARRDASMPSLDRGRPLDSGIASRMSHVFGRTFSAVRIHTGSDAAAAASAMNARAFTIGGDIAFAAGEYQPGTIIGDALLAHELAHVAQQDGARDDGALQKNRDSEGAPLERDADDAAVHAVLSIWGRTTRFARQLRTTAAPRLKSQLRLQRCAHGGGQQAGQTTTPAQQQQQPATQPATPPSAAAGTTPCPASVAVGQALPFGHGDLSPSEKDNWRTYLGVVSLMNVGPGPDHRNHCLREHLSSVTVANSCPPSVATATNACSRHWCLDVGRYGTAGDAATHRMVSDSPTSFVDLHKTSKRDVSLLEGTGVSSCSLACQQTYTCDSARGPATTGVFTITRNFVASTHQKADGTTVHITTGSATKT